MEPNRLGEAIASAQAGDPAGFQALLDAYGRRLYGYFLRATGDHHDAEDLLSEMSLRLVRRLKSYDEKGRFEPWLFRIAANLVRDRIRRRRARPAPLSLSAPAEDGRALGERVAGEGEAVSGPLEAAEEAQALHRALDRLDERTREMILLRHFAQMSFREVARACGCPLGTVLARVHRGVRKLRGLMSADDEAG
jgi:RNA polymerase sigma-70 factor (ECF subfamily)